MSVTSESVNTDSGVLYCMIFENPEFGVPRKLYWNFALEDAELEFEDSVIVGRIACEGLDLPLQDWRELNKEFNLKWEEQGLESTFYGQYFEDEDQEEESEFPIEEHIPAAKTVLSVKRLHDNVFSLKASLSLDASELFDTDEALMATGSGEVPFLGLAVAEDLANNAQEAIAVASDFVDLSLFGQPELDEELGYLFKPIQS